MLGEKRRQEPMFYHIRIEDLIPDDHLLRLVDRHIDFTFIRDKVKHLYSHTGRPSIVPEVMLRMLLIGYFYGITSERRLCEEVKMRLSLFANSRRPKFVLSTFKPTKTLMFTSGFSFNPSYNSLIPEK